MIGYDVSATPVTMRGVLVNIHLPMPRIQRMPSFQPAPSVQPLPRTDSVRSAPARIVAVAGMVALLLCLGWVLPAAAEPIDRLQVRIVTGAQELSAGSLLELRVYSTDKGVRKIPLSHGEAWPRASTRVIPITLSETLDARTVQRFALYYRAASPLSPAFEVVEAEVEIVSGRAAPQRLLNTTLSGVIAGQGELASGQREGGPAACASDADCDDHRRCNGHEHCSPRAAGADARGCVKGFPIVCPVNQVCTEDKGCRGLDAAPATTAPDAPGADAPSSIAPSAPSAPPTR